VGSVALASIDRYSRLLEILHRLPRKERRLGEGYRVIDAIYSPTFYATMPQMGYIEAAIPLGGYANKRRKS
jgi:hypothetical protein